MQQNLPLSWDDSEQNIEDNIQPKPLFLKRAAEDQVQEMDDYEKSSGQNIEEEIEPRPLLLKKAVTSEEDRENWDNVETVDLSTPPVPPLLLKKSSEVEEVEEVKEEDDFDDYESEMDQEEVDYSEYSDPEKDTANYLEVIQESETEIKEEDIPENENTDETFDEERDTSEEENADEVFDEERDISKEYESEEDALEEVDNEAESEENSETADSTPLFAETGTFSLEHEPEDEFSESEESIETETEEENLEDKRIEIEEGLLESAMEDADEPEQSAVEESVFALKAETYHEIEPEIEDHEPEETVEEKSLEDIAIPTDVTTHESFQTLGALLQEARLAKSFTIKDAAEATRIKSSYIIALENNELDELPARVYILNYIRQLAREYNISHTPLIEAYEQQDGIAEKGEPHVMRVGDEDARKATKPTSKLNAMLVVSTLLLFGLLVFVAFYMKWIDPGTNLAEHPPIEINLDDLKEETVLPTPELPVP